MFTVLGPFDARIDGQPVVSGRNRQRTVLALLALEVNRSVPVERIVQAVWGNEPPTTAGAQVQTCVWRLRKALTQTGNTTVRIDTTASGYRLHAPDDWVDARLFEARVAAARAATTTGDTAQAVAAYRAALSLVHGPILADLDSPLLAAVSARWEDRRLAALEEYATLELARGRGHLLVDDLAAAVARHPLHERLRGQLMRALLAAGRRADALRVYREGREATVEQLGMEPSVELQQLHQAILADAQASATPNPLRGVPTHAGPGHASAPPARSGRLLIPAGLIRRYGEWWVSLDR